MTAPDPRPRATPAMSRRAPVATLVLALLTLLPVLLAPSPAAADAAFVSDDFSAAALAPPWRVVDPVGDGTATLVGQGTSAARLALSLPAGSSHDLWGAANRSLRALQDVTDSDFAIDVAFDSVPTAKFQTEGVLVQQDASNWVRFDVYHDGVTLRAFAATTVAGVSTKRLAVAASATTSVVLRVSRLGDDWTYGLRADGGPSRTIGTFRHPLSVASVGPFAANHGATSSAAPAFTALVDYAFDAARPIEPEDPVVPGGPASPSPPPSSQPSAPPSASAQPSPSASSPSASPPPASPPPASPPASPPPAGALSDDFSATSLRPDWRVVDPLGDGTVRLQGQGTADATVELSVPAGRSHDSWGTNRSLRLMTPVADEDLALEVKFDSVPSARYQTQGVLLEQDAGTWLRFDVYHDGTALRAFAASTSGGTSSTRLTATLPSAGAPVLRITRAGDDYTFVVVSDGTARTIGAFSAPLHLTSVGPYAANHATGDATVPAFTARVDYLFDLGSPVVPEDGATPGPTPSPTLSPTLAPTGSPSPDPDITAPQILGLAVAKTSSTATFTWRTDEPAAGTVELGSNPAYDRVAESPAGGSQHSVELSGLSPGASYHYRVSARDGAGNTTSTVDATFRTRDPHAPPVIDLWYGDDLVVGGDGQAQQWVNVLGNVTDGDGLSSFGYRLNGGPARALTRGPDNRRLQLPGDFNVDLAWSDLLVGRNVVDLTAVDRVGRTTLRPVVVTRVAAGAAAGAPSLVRQWTAADPLTAQAQPVDGAWRLEDGRVRSDAPGYDRVLALGDLGWRDYELTTTMTPRALGPSAYSYLSGPPLLGVALRWQGHSVVDGKQPAWGFYGTGAYAWLRWFETGPKLELKGTGGSPARSVARTAPLGTSFALKVRAVTLSPGTTRYSVKLWVSGTTEPAGWLAEIDETAGPATGSVALISHHLVADFGDVRVRPL